MSPSEDILIKKILDLQVKLLNDHNLPSLFSYHSKNGQVNFGSKHVISKFRNDFDCNWEETFDADRKELMRQTSEMPPYYDEEEWGKPINFVKAHLPPMKLPADLDLCVYKELWKWVSWEILKEYWKMGGLKLQVNFGKPEFLASFWPNDVWP